MVRVPRKAPTHPGQMLLEEFLEPLGMTQTELAERMEVLVQRINSHHEWSEGGDRRSGATVGSGVRHHAWILDEPPAVVGPVSP